ncbi:hypothetical protein FHU30_002903 [Actinomadura rupiterrae]|nr:hypothetical protein [Actinomadura rupiterrae]
MDLNRGCAATADEADPAWAEPGFTEADGKWAFAVIDLRGHPSQAGRGDAGTWSK